MTDPIVELRDVSKVFRASREVVALSGVSLTLGAGESLAVVGPSGSGKSTLLAIAGTLERPTSGSVLVEGSVLTTLSDSAVSRLRARRIGFVFQGFHLLERLTALGNVSEALMYGGVVGNERDDRSHEILLRVGLDQRANHFPYQLSGGERQRVAVARAMANEPSLLVADEPTGDLDPETGAAVVETMLGVGGGVSLLIATHNPSVADRMGRQVRLENGRILADPSETL